jgi:hypothetical protein
MYFNGLDIMLPQIDFLVLFIVSVMVVKSGGWCVRLHFLMIFPSLSDPDSQENLECVGLAEISM